MKTTSIGIAALGIAIPRYYLPLSSLAELRQVDPQKYLTGLGCEEMAICFDGETPIELGIRAGQRALAHWGQSPQQIGLVAVGTESGIDASCPLSIWIAQALGLAGEVRSYEVKHACYGATLALRQAMEWILSGNNHGKAALVIATDTALYAPKHPGEPTQGAGAIAMVVGPARIAEISPHSYPFSQPKFDFMRPLDQPYPEVDGPLSLQCYCQAMVECFKQFADGRALVGELLELAFLACHVPFPKMVQKAIHHLGQHHGWERRFTQQLFEQKVAPSFGWNKKLGNAYTASLWISVASCLTQMQTGEQVGAFSYGSGFGAELMTLRSLGSQANAPWVEELNQDFQTRQALTSKQYTEFRQSASALPK